MGLLLVAGYFRGLAHIAGFLLIVMGLENEEHAFWVLTTLLEDKLFSYCPGQVGTRLKASAVSRLLAVRCPCCVHNGSSKELKEHLQ